ncbi:MAG: hypothetical protein ACE5K0_10865 [Candidatus Methanofastidiosia archaeon]
MKGFLLDNLDIARNKNNITISVNPGFYPLDAVFSVAYVFVDKAYILVDGDPNDRITIKIKPKHKNIGLEELETLFSNELYARVGKKKYKSYLEDPEGIAVPWGKRFRKKK